jgi:hypothetical protein
MPQLDSFVFCESSVSILLFFWIITLLFVYILTPLMGIRSLLVSLIRSPWGGQSLSNKAYIKKKYPRSYPKFCSKSRDIII